MRKNHREIGEERFVLIRLDEVDEKTSGNVGAITLLGQIKQLAILYE